MAHHTAPDTRIITRKLGTIMAQGTQADHLRWGTSAWPEVKA